MLMDTDLDGTQEDYVRTAQGSGKALVSLINEVLDLAKIESGKLELEAVQFDVRAALDNVLSLFCGKSQEKGLEVTISQFLFSPNFVSCSLKFKHIVSNYFLFKWKIFSGVQLAVYISEKVPEMLIGDPGRFRQIITNLVGNSIKVSVELLIFIFNRLEIICHLAKYVRMVSKTIMAVKMLSSVCNRQSGERMETIVWNLFYLCSLNNTITN